jgi:hypothetical protein
MKIKEGVIDGKYVFFIYTKWGKLTFETLADAKKFLKIFLAKCPDYSDFDLYQQDLQDEKKEWLNIALTLAFISIAVKAQDDMKKIQLAGIELMRDFFFKLSAPTKTVELAQKKLAEKKKRASTGFRP